MSEEATTEQAPQTTSEKWGDPIDEDRKQALWARLRAWWEEVDHGGRIGPFAYERLTGAEVFWLAVCALAKKENTVEEEAFERFSGVSDMGAPLVRNLSLLCLQRANLRYAELKGADLTAAQLERVDLVAAKLERADLHWAKLQGAQLVLSELQGANLSFANLEMANLRKAEMERANLDHAHLESADLREAQLSHANLQGASLDKKTQLAGATLSDTRLDGTIFDNTNLTGVDWTVVPCLQDERLAQQERYWSKRKNRDTFQRMYQAAMRAYRLLAVTLLANGMSEEASYYAYRAQIMQREVYRYSGWGSFGRWLFSWMLALFAGYGYRLGNILIAYAGTVLLFAAGFLVTGVANGHTALSVPSALDALEISLNAIHGRVFFAQFGLDTVQSWLATAESIVGIVIESLFAAILIQRFFNR